MPYNECHIFLIAVECSGYISEEKCENCPKRNPKLRDVDYVMLFGYIPENRQAFRKLMREGGCLRCGSSKKPVDMQKHVYNPDARQTWMVFGCPDCGLEYRVRISNEDFILFGAEEEK